MPEDLPQADQFEQMSPTRKRLMDTIKMLAYRAETAMVNLARKKMSHEDEARSLIRGLLTTEADIIPDTQNNMLQIRVHSLSNNRSNRAVKHLMTYLNDAEFVFPGTNNRMVYQLSGAVDL